MSSLFSLFVNFFIVYSSIFEWLKIIIFFAVFDSIIEYITQFIVFRSNNIIFFNDGTICFLVFLRFRINMSQSTSKINRFNTLTTMPKLSFVLYSIQLTSRFSLSYKIFQSKCNNLRRIKWNASLRKSSKTICWFVLYAYLF